MPYYSDAADAFLDKTYAEHNAKTEIAQRAVLEFLLGNETRTVERDNRPLEDIEMEYLRKNDLM